MIVHDDDDWLRCLGVLPHTHSASDEEWVRELMLYVSDTERVLLPWDGHDDSVRLSYSVGSDRPLVEVFREKVLSLTAGRRGTVATVEVVWGSDSLAGRAAHARAVAAGTGITRATLCRPTPPRPAGLFPRTSGRGPCAVQNAGQGAAEERAARMPSWKGAASKGSSAGGSKITSGTRNSWMSSRRITCTSSGLTPVSS